MDEDPQLNQKNLTLLLYSIHMLIILHSSIDPLKVIFLFLLLTISITTADDFENSTILHFTTSFTKCSIAFQLASQITNISNIQSLPNYQFKSCQIKKCSRLGSTEECKSSVTIQLEQQNCYLSCCKSHIFNASQCLHNNQTIQIQTQNMNNYLFIILALCALGLIVAMTCFFINQLKCFRKDAPIKKEGVAPKWRKAKYQDNKCIICDQYGAILQTACKHYFHLTCFKQKIGEVQLSGQCPICEQISKRYRVWCGQCHQRYIKIGFTNIKTVSQLQLFYVQSKFLHDDCLRDFNCYAKTDLRLTSSTND